MKQKTPSTLGLNCDLTIMALDNDKGRHFVARRCQYVHRNPQPCLNLGTGGLQLSTDAIIPNVTMSWVGMVGVEEEKKKKLQQKKASQRNVGEERKVTTEEGKPTEQKEGDPCQERAVPKTIKHCVSFAKRQFDLLFVGIPNQEEPLSMVRVRDWNECIVWARKLFDFCNESWVVDVKTLHPNASDSIYHGRALPDIVPFDPSDEIVQHFIGSAAILKAFANEEPQIEPALCETTRASFAAIALAASSLQLSLFDDVNKSRSRISAFEKDEDTNFHVEFIAACANLKACMFHVTPIICKLLQLFVVYVLKH
jgi:ubiquitin-activating enzyme E1